MSNPIRPARATRRRFSVVVILAAAWMYSPASLPAQAKHQAVVQIEVGDSIGLPLPDAKVDVFAFMDGGVFWEWVPIDSIALPSGINLLRFSHPGYRSITFSVPVREKTTLSLRVRLEPERDTTTTSSDNLDARLVRAIGLLIEGRAHTDIVGRRRVIGRSAFERDAVTRFGPLMRRMRNTELKVVPASGGSFRVFAESPGGAFRCSLQVMVNGDRRRVLPFETFDELFSVGDVEAIEIFPMASSVPLSYQVPRAGSGCGLMVVWFRAL